MVSSLTSRLFACSRNSNSSTTCSGSSGHKRRLETSGQSVRPDSLSGYSADREDSSSSPPFSIDVSNGTTHDNMREMNNCPKRQRRNELQFAASSVKADLARAGYEFSTVDPMKESTTMLSSATINLKGVKLVHSKSFQKMPIITTGAVAGSPYDYQALALACFESYPSNYSGSTLSNQEVASSQDSDRSTSSVSESDTDSVTSKGNSDDFPGMMIPPLFQEESEEAYMERPRESNSCHVVSSESSAITMSETMTLTTTPRVVTLSSSPFSIVYANAAFLRLSGIPADRVLGSGFSSVAVSQTMDGDAKPILLSDCMVSSCSGNHKKLRLVRNQDEEKQEPVERYAKVVPIVSKRPVHGAEVSNVTHYSIELICDQDNSDELADSLSSLTKGNMSQIKRQSHGSGMAVGVMG